MKNMNKRFYYQELLLEKMAPVLEETEMFIKYDLYRKTKKQINFYPEEINKSDDVKN